MKSKLIFDTINHLDNLNLIVSNKSIDNIDEDKSLIPQTLMELGLIQTIINNKTEAKKYFQKALKHFSGYTTEGLVQIRIHSAIKNINSKVEDEDKDHLNANLSQFLQIFH